jgi:hypothetical protein
MKQFILSSLLASAVALVGMSRAEAGFTISLISESGTGPFTYTYSAAITSTDTIVAGDFFRVYDFGSYVAGSIAAPAGWTASVSLVNPTPPPNVILTHGDDPAIWNLIYTYTGSTPIVGPTTITGFTAQSMTGGGAVVTKDFVGRNNETVGSSFVDAVGDVLVPAVVPEPSSVALLGLGGVGVIGLLARRRKV